MYIGITILATLLILVSVLMVSGKPIKIEITHHYNHKNLDYVPMQSTQPTEEELKKIEEEEIKRNEGMNDFVQKLQSFMTGGDDIG